MTNPQPKKFLSALDLIAGLALGLTVAIAQAAPVGQVTHLSGTLSVQRIDGTTKLLSVKSEIQEGDILSTEDETYARVKFADGGEVVLRPNTQLKLDAYAFNKAKPASDNVVMSMLKGGLRAVTGLIGKRNREKVSFSTTTATIGIRGTHFGALLCQNDCARVPTVSGRPPENGLHVDVAQGAVVVTNPAGQQVLNAGQFGFVRSAATPPVIVPPQQGVPVTMPSSIAKNESKGQGVGKGKDSECAVQ